MKYDIIILGGGPAGVFAAIHAAASPHPPTVLLIEQSHRLLSKVSLSGGGRCNLTNAISELQSFASNYPRGSRELLGPLHTFGPRETISWFTEHGVPLTTESDGRLFPKTMKSSSIVECLLQQLTNRGVLWRANCPATAITHENRRFTIETPGEMLECTTLIVATGSHPSGYQIAQAMGHTVVPPVPSLFPLRIDNFAYGPLAGLSFNPVRVTILPEASSQRKTRFSNKRGYQCEGPILISHEGLSGPVILSLSSLAARFLAERNYQAPISIHWLPLYTRKELHDLLVQCKKAHAKKQIKNENPYQLPQHFWNLITSEYGEQRYCELSDEAIQSCIKRLTNDAMVISGRALHREEMVTCGGISLREVNFKTMESRLRPGLFFAGEILDIDGVTGGFNLQNAWTTGYIAGNGAQKALGSNYE